MILAIIIIGMILGYLTTGVITYRAAHALSKEKSLPSDVAAEVAICSLLWPLVWIGGGVYWGGKLLIFGATANVKIPEMIKKKKSNEDRIRELEAELGMRDGVDGGSYSPAKTIRDTPEYAQAYDSLKFMGYGEIAAHNKADLIVRGNYPALHKQYMKEYEGN